MRPISDETLAQILARAAALLELSSLRESELPGGEVGRVHDLVDSAEACRAADRVLRGRA